MRTLDQLIAARSPESRARIEKLTAKARQDIILARLCKALNISQPQLTAALADIKQPSIVKIKKIENDPRLSVLKRYATALGGELILSITLADGQRIVLIP